MVGQYYHDHTYGISTIAVITTTSHACSAQRELVIMQSKPYLSCCLASSCHVFWEHATCSVYFTSSIVHGPGLHMQPQDFLTPTFDTMQAVKLAGQLGDYRRSQASHAVQHHALYQHHPCASSGLLIPLFAMSSVTGLGLPVLHAFLNALPALPQTATPPVEPCTTAQQFSQTGSAAGVQNGGALEDSAGPAVNGAQVDHQTHTSNGKGMMPERDARVQAAGQQIAATHFQVDHTFEVKGVGCVVSGTVVSGSVAVGQHFNLGPTGQGLFSQVQVTCIHRSQVQPPAASSHWGCFVGQRGCFASNTSPIGVPVWAMYQIEHVLLVLFVSTTHVVLWNVFCIFDTNQ